MHIGSALDTERSAFQLVESLKYRLGEVRRSVPLSSRPRVVVLEWPDPPYAPGHWVPDMIEAAGGRCVLGARGEKSTRVTWEHLLGLKVDIIVAAYCGYHLADNERECDKLVGNSEWTKFTSAAKLYASDASSYFSRPGNRLIDGTELLAHIIHGVAKYKPEAGCASIRGSDGWFDLANM